MLKQIFFYLSILIYCPIFSQSVEGFVLDINSEPIPYVKVWVKNYNNLYAITNEKGYYKIVFNQVGTYDVLYTSVMYKDQTHTIVIENQHQNIRKDVYLEEDVTQLNTVEVKGKKKNVGYEIIKKVIAHKKENPIYPKALSFNVYIKGTETFDLKKKKSKDDEEDVLIEDSFEKEKELDDPLLNMVETNLTIDIEYPNKIKETKIAQTKVGYPSQIYLMESPIYVDANFDFYSNLLYKDRLHETPIISPLHYAGILSYKYKLVDILTEDLDTIYKIHIKPRNYGTTTLEGELYVKKNEWVLTKADLKMHKGNLKAYDDFRIIQEYKKIDKYWLVTKQTFIYETKYGKEIIKGETEVIYSNYNLNPDFSVKYFNNEIAQTQKDAYKKDSSYWNNIRPIKLSVEEQRNKFVQDSITEAHHKKEYLDSIDLAFNKITLADVFINGVSFRNREKKTQWSFPSLPGLIDPINIAGPRIDPYFGLFKRFENDKKLYAAINTSIGVYNKDIRGGFRFIYLYNPLKLARFNIFFDHNIDMINSNVPYLTNLSPSNYYFNDGIQITHKFEVVNGLFLNTDFNLDRRSSISNLKFYNWQGDFLQMKPPISFDPYNIFKTDFSLSYTPQQKYRTEPTQKIILGSRWPTIKLNYKKGWKNVLGSHVNFDQIELSIFQTFNIKTFGKSYYIIEGGKFINQDSVYYIDQKFFRAGDIGLTSLLMSPQKTSFQNLAQAYQTRGLYLEFHYVHNFNGYIINKIPYMKKLRITSSVGGGMLFIPEYNNLYYQEIFFGVKRSFKFLSERFKLGAFVILSNSNYQPPKVQFKIMFELINLKDVMFRM